MPLRLEMKRRLTARSDRVKSTDLHPVEPWMLASLYNGNVHIWNYESQQLVKSLEVCDLPVRAAKFVSRKNWVVTGSDDMKLNVFNYNTLERVSCLEAHSDYLRSLAVHPSEPLVLSSSDDMLIKLWNWDKAWACEQVFEGHTHYIMQVVINPKDNNTFASASLDRTIKVWHLGASCPNFTLEGHDKGVNCLDYYHAGDKPYLISGADDRSVKIWDYQNKNCVQTLEGHAQNIASVCFHPELPIILTGSEDGTRVWSISSLKGSNNVSIGYDEGSILVKLGREEPAMSMDSSGKIVWAKHSELQQGNLKTLGDVDLKDGETLPISVKDMGSCEIYPQTITHNSNGRANEKTEEDIPVVSDRKILKEFLRILKEKQSLKPEFGIESIYGGCMLGVKSPSGLAFYDWETLELIRRIETQPRSVCWSDNGELVALITDECYFILRYQKEIVAYARETKQNVSDDGIEEALNRLNYYVGGEIVTISHLDRTMYILGYIPSDNKLYLGDKELHVVSFQLLLSVLEYQTAVMRRDFDTADKVLPVIPRDQRDLKTAQSLVIENPGEQKWKQLAELAIANADFDLAQSCLKEAKDFGGLLLLATSLGNNLVINYLSNSAAQLGRKNISFISSFLMGNLENCLDILISTNRLPEAAFFSRTYLPTLIPKRMELLVATEYIGSNDDLGLIHSVENKEGCNSLDTLVTNENNIERKFSDKHNDIEAELEGMRLDCTESNFDSINDNELFDD
ncbi:COPB2 [Lepeophtheirus salmonis]|uniref:Beta'-coat protein n=1 Tax=Lepeophtheirus salmonis TaxID=72036 RepID=A0A7R8CH18_LEPSM|nr:COPB2 [Lepeophtheirus salmonis]CAF2816462.1 COPB2 [Lepeophtheirus salmonis]